ncbi:MAG TPA: HD domain-containing phosphohydrolase [Nitrospirota bacterium]
MKTTLLATLRFKLAFFIIILLLLTAAIFSLLTVRTMNRHILDEVLKRAESLGKSTAALAPYSILSGDLLGMDNIVSKIKEANDDVEYAAVINTELTTLAHTDIANRGGTFKPYRRSVFKENKDGTRVYETRSDTGALFEIVAPVLFDSKQIGEVVIGINKSALLHAKAETRRWIVAGFGITMALGIGCIIVLSSLITRPIQELSRGVADLQEGRRSKLRVYSHDELGSLTESFNKMTERITKQQGKLGAYAAELEDAYVSTVKVLAAAIDARDPYTHGHSTRVAKLSLAIGASLGFSSHELEDLEIASLFHDVGKLKTPDFVLLKEGPLDPHEHREISNHCENGATILGRAPSLQKYIPAVRHHHEWFNGEGYPAGLSGEDIPLHAAIIAVADAFDAMTTARPYKNPRSPEDALGELMRYSGKQFTPRIVEVFRRIIESRPEYSEQFSLRG